jgi:hypothetical protein
MGDKDEDEGDDNEEAADDLEAEMPAPEMPAEETVEVADEIAVEGADDSNESEELEEATELSAVATPKGGDNGANADSPVSSNGGAKRIDGADPVKMGDAKAEAGGKAPAVKDNPDSPAQGNAKLSPAPKAKA